MNNQIYKFAKKIFYFPRSITGMGVRQTLKEIQKIIPELKICSVKSGTKVFDWTIPKEWKVNDAYILTPEGKKICHFKKNNLHLVGYSTKINKVISKKELLQKLYSLPDQPNAIPYVTSYYKKNWGFCLSQNQKNKLPNGNYKILINSKHFNGNLNYGEIILKGKSKKEVFLSTYICHPALANNEISGPSVLTYLSKWIKSKKNRRYTYRIIFIPETIGSITYLSKKLSYLKKNVRYGYNLSCVGDDRNFSFLESRYGNTLTDKLTKYVLNKKKIKFKNYNWLNRGSDERQYCSPGVDLPICSLMRTKHGLYKEYHTSLDKLGTVVTSKGLNKSFNIYKSCIEQIENNILPKTTILCEPQMGRRGLYPNISTKKSGLKVRMIMNILSLCDGNNSINDLVNILKIRTKYIYKTIKMLKKSKLIKFID